MEEREVVRCQNCRCNQFRTRSGYCRKCGELLGSAAPCEAPIIEMVESAPTKRRNFAPHIGKSRAKPDNCEVGAAVKRLRELSDMTQQELAEKCGLNRSNISRVESSPINFGMPMIKHLAAIFGVTPLALILGPDASELIWRFPQLSEEQQRSVCISAKAMCKIIPH